MKHLLLITIAAVVLLGCGPSVDIWTAAEQGDIKAVKQHLDAGADLDAAVGEGGMTPLFIAARQGHKEIAELLIANGADVNVGAANGRTPLHWAAIRDLKEIVELLIANGADVNAKDSDRWTPLHYASSGNRRTTMMLIFASRTHTLTAGVTNEVAELLIANGADVNAEEKMGGTPLHYAAQNGHKEIVELLIANGVDVNDKGLFGMPPLILAESRDIIELLIVAGADVNFSPENGITPLADAVIREDKESAKLLISSGADVNSKDRQGHTPLDTANNIVTSKAALKEITSLLRKHGGKTGEELKAEGK